MVKVYSPSGSSASRNRPCCPPSTARSCCRRTTRPGRHRHLSAEPRRNRGPHRRERPRSGAGRAARCGRRAAQPPAAETRSLNQHRRLAAGEDGEIRPSLLVCPATGHVLPRRIVIAPRELPIQAGIAIDQRHWRTFGIPGASSPAPTARTLRWWGGPSRIVSASAGGRCVRVVEVYDPKLPRHSRRPPRRCDEAGPPPAQ